MFRARQQGSGLVSSSGRSSRSKASRSCSEIVKSSGCATWCGDQGGSLRRCGLIVGSMGSIFAGKALYGSDAVTANPAKSGGASESASRGMRTDSCDFIFEAVRSSAVQDRFGNKRRYYGRSRFDSGQPCASGSQRAIRPVSRPYLRSCRSSSDRNWRSSCGRSRVPLYA